MSSAFVGNYTSSLYNASKRYRMKHQRSVPLSDVELVEIQDVSDTFVRQLVASNFPRGSSINNGFQVVQSGSPANNFTIKGGDGTITNPGVLFVDGYILFIKSDIEYTGQDATGALTDDDYTKTSIPALTTPGGARSDEIYVDFYFSEVSATAGSEYTDTSLIVSGIGSATANRVRQVQDIRVAEGGVTPSDGNDGNGIYHRYVKIATLARTATANIDTAMITDNRIKINSVNSLSQGTTITDVLTSSGQNIGNDTHRVGQLFMASTIDYKTNDLMFKNNGAERLRFTTGGNVGIGSTVPTKALVISDGTVNIAFEHTATGAELGTDSNHPVMIKTNALEAVRILANGKVGIGITNPTSTLHVLGDAIISNNLTVNGTTTTVNTEVTTTDMMTINQDDNQVALQVNQTVAGNTADVMQVTNAGTGAIATFVGIGTGTARVGIGTANPTYSLDVNGSVNIISSGLYRIATQAVLGMNGSNIIVGTSNAYSLQFDAGGSSRMVINTNGNVGIGITNPSYFFSVNKSNPSGSTVIAITNPGGSNGSLLETCDIIFEHANGGTGGYGGIIRCGKDSDWNGSINIDGNLQFITSLNGSGVERMRINSAGNVGIGTKSPSYKLDVVGTNIVANFGTDPSVIRVGGAGESYFGGYYAAGSNINNSYIGNNIYFNGSTWVRPNTGGNTAMFSASNGGFYFQTGQTDIGTTKLVISNVGNVGIGTNNPTYKLDVVGTNIVANFGTDPSVIRVGGAAEAYFGGTYAAGSNVNNSYIGNNIYFNGSTWVRPNTGCKTALLSVSNGVFNFITGQTDLGTTKLVISNVGNVGIGTTSPEYILSLKQDQNATSRMYFENTNTGTAATSMFQLAGNGGSLYLYNTSTGYTPNGFLNTAGGAVEGSGAGGLSVAATQASGYIRFYTGGTTEKMRIAANGNVGIGTTDPTCKLDIAGLVKFQDTSTSQRNSSTFVNLFSYQNGSSGGTNAKVAMISMNNIGWRIGLYNGASWTGYLDIASSDYGTPIIQMMGCIVGIGTLSGTGNRAVYSDASGNLTNTSSDATLKTNVEDLQYGLEQVLLLRPVSYNWIDTDKRGAQDEVGLIAQEVQEVIPEVVGTNSDETLSLDYPKLVAVLINAIKELKAELDALKASLI